MKQLFSHLFWPQSLLIVALVAAITSSGLLLLQWQQQQTATQIQLLNNSASLLSVQPLLQNQAAPLEVTLQALQQHSALPIRAMAVFDQSQRVFASTNKSESWLEQAAQSLDSEYAELNDSGGQLISTPIWADSNAQNKTITAHAQMGSGQTPAPAVSSRQLGYLLVFIDEIPTSTFRILSPMFLLVLIALGLIWLTIKQTKRWQLQQVALLTERLQQDEALEPVTEPALLQLVTVWQQRKLHIQQQAYMQSQELQKKLIQLDAQLQLSQQSTTLLSAKQQEVVAQLQTALQQLDSWQQLAANAERQMPIQLLRRMKLLALYTRLRSPDFMLQPDAVLLPEWLHCCFKEYLDEPESNSQFLFEEDPQAFAFKVNLDPILLAHLLALLTSMCRQLATEPEIICSYRLIELPNKLLKVNIKFVGHSFPLRWRQVLTGVEDNMLPDDLEAEVSRCILKQLRASIHIDSIEDVGTQLEVMLPVSWQKTNRSKLFQSILIVDEKECRLPLAKQSLSALGEQVHCCNGYSKLLETLQRRLVDLVVLVLPDHSAKLAINITELNAMQQRFQIQALAYPADVAYWQSLLSFPVSPMPLLIGNLSTPQPQLLAQQQLLVVDDNPTNLSYVRAVLALEGLRIDIAMTGDEAIKMAANNRYQLILMDIQLPDLPGTEVTKQIRQLRHHQQTVILAFTAHALPDEIASFRLAGMDDVLIKPLDTQKIAHILARIKAMDQN